MRRVHQVVLGSLVAGSVAAGGLAVVSYPERTERAAQEQVQQEAQKVMSEVGYAVQYGAPGSTEEDSTAKIDTDDVASHGRFIASTEGLDVGLFEQPFEPILVPGDGKNAWAVVDPAHNWQWSEQATKLVMMHSSPYVEQTPGNALIKNGVPTLEAGEQLTVDGLTFEVQSTQVINKNTISDMSIWENVPGRLIVVTCSPIENRAHSSANVVIIAQQVTS